MEAGRVLDGGGAGARKAPGKGIVKSSAIVGAFTALSRVLGLVREMFQSRLIGAGMEQSAFAIAFAIPNAARKLFGEGALTAAFVPVFKATVETESLEKAAKLARSVMTMVLLMLGALVILSLGGVEAFAALAERAGALDERLALTLRLVRTLLAYMIFICAAAFGMGVLNALGRFKASSFMPCILNIVWIGTLAGLAFFPGVAVARRVHIVAFAILCAGAAQMSYLFWRMGKAGVRARLSFSGWRDSKVALVWRNVGIGALGAGAVQLNYLLDQALAYYASDWAAGVIVYAERLMDLPLGIVGVAFGTVLLPVLAGLFAKGDREGARAAFTGSVKSLMFVMLPASAGLFALSREITEVVYEGGSFDALATLRTSRALCVYALGLASFGLMKSIVPWFQAQGDMKTPLKVSVATVALNAVLNIAAVLTLDREWRHVGLAFSTVLCSFAGCIALTVLAHRRNGSLGLGECVAPVAKIAAASVVMGVVVWMARQPAAAFAATLFAGEGARRIFALALLVASGGVVYFSAMLATGANPLRIAAAIRRRRG